MKSQGRYILQLQLIHLYNSHPTDSRAWPHMCGECARAIKEGGRKEMSEVCKYYYEYVPRGGCHCFSQGYISMAVGNSHGLPLYAQGITYCILAICSVSNSITK